ncbi:peptide chain release factor N(5)-glutamine methyltransferase [Geobacter pelophilus]|uniref:Release factor glutamine methyltransferase n=1 Tax=Geoanaerobacter pelophilus TaxID=60036 RepID=A0AAW4L741_9BACT|nr:peptide chain release factor N(5)-glutamine methyltransferase [Geoanaerobacter pelophilus]MBT0663834.1 peptide chain release factor N(5)-glutamine methyltransferase [Geoanaerobacter pelophilus]
MTEKIETWTIRKVLDWTKSYLADKGVDNARLESEWLLAAITGHDRVGLYVNYDQPLTDAELANYRSMVARRAKREPLQYILGTQEFYGVEFEVSPAVLIPRHDTEVLVMEALQRAPQAKTVLDIGVGSGCIALALARSLPEADVCGVEKSPEALKLAQRNAEHLGVRVTLCEGSLFEPFLGQRFDLVVSNPPYIPTADLAGLQPEVRDYEPLGALDGGADGLDFYRAIIASASQHLNPGGWLMVEVGIDQSMAVRELFAATGFTEIFIARDPQQIERVVGGKII